MNQIISPVVPFNVQIPGGVLPGKIIKIVGSTYPNAHRFAINLLCGGMGDIALHIGPKFHEHKVIRNSVQNMNWGHEEHHGHLPIHAGQGFEIMIMCDPQYFKIAFNGQHFTEFRHRISTGLITNLAMDGEVNVSAVYFEGAVFGGVAMPPVVPPPYTSHAPSGHVPYPGVGLGVPYPNRSPSPHHHHHVTPAYVPGVATAGFVGGSTHDQGNRGYPTTTGTYPTTTGIYPTTTGAYPTSTGYPPAYPHSPKEHKKTGILDKAGMAVAAALGGSALGHGVGHHHNNNNKLGLLGTGVGAAAAGAVLTGHNPIKALKKQKKAQKKALKYGLPLAGAGIGAYALHKGMKKMHHGHHGHHHGSSSSSSSSSD